VVSTPFDRLLAFNDVRRLMTSIETGDTTTHELRLAQWFLVAWKVYTPGKHTGVAFELALGYGRNYT
jgi:hypothetical protein